MRTTTRFIGSGILMMTAALTHAADRPALVATPFDPADVRLLPGRFKDNANRAGAYLLSLDADRLLSGFRTDAGLAPKAAKYGGWENAGVAGHSLGHYLSGLALAYASTGDPRFKDKAAYAAGELAECQKANGNGYVAAIPNGKKLFAEVARGDIRFKGFDLNEGWVPWYTMHKVMAGLRDVAVHTGDAQAKAVLVGLADWAADNVSKLSEQQMQRVLHCEHGGMNEVLADVSVMTGDAKYLKLAARFNHKAVLDPLAAGQDNLNGLHANTQIPKLIGAARQYELTGDAALGRAARTFWNAVAGHHTYVTGGNSNAEHFGPPDVLSTRLSDTSTETCNTYNMLKLTGHLFGWTGDAKYVDFYERALVNHILGSQNPKTAEVTYYVPLKSGAKRRWETRYDSFTCCVGTGMENHVKYGDAVYAHAGGETLWVNLFVASELAWKDAGVKVRLDSPFPAPGDVTLTIDTPAAKRFVMNVRRPAWATEFAVSVNGTPVADAGRPGQYVAIDREWKAGDRVVVRMPYRLRTEPQPDKADQVAILNGPVVLAQKIDKPTGRRTVLVDGSGELLQSIKPAGDGPLAFRTSGVGKPDDFTLMPFYDASDTHYAVFFDRFTPEQWAEQQQAYEAGQARQREIDRRTVDVLAIGEMQPERDHDVTGERTSAGEAAGRKYRDAGPGGFFEFTLKADPAADNRLVVTYWGGESPRRTFDVLVDGKAVARQVLDNDRPGEFFDVTYALPKSEKGQVRVRLASVDGSMAGGCFGARVVRAE